MGPRSASSTERASATSTDADSNARTTYAQNAQPSLSPGSSDTHALVASAPLAEDDASQSATRVDLPNPGGAETTVSLDRAPRSRSSDRRGRATRPGRGRGT